MSDPNNFSYFVKEGLSDKSFIQIKENVSVKEESVVTLDPVEEKYENDEHSEKYKNYEIELHGEVKQDNVSRYIQKKSSSHSYTNNLEESQQDPLATNYNILQYAKKEYPCIDNIKEEQKEEYTVDEEEKYNCQDVKYNIDFLEHKVESSAGDNDTFRSILEDNIPGGSGSRRNGVSLRGQNIHKQITNYKCNESHETESSAFSIKMHIDSFYKEIKNYECNKCHERFSHDPLLKGHIKNVHKEIKNYKCEECHKTFQYQHTLRHHINSVHKGIKNYECNECQKKFAQASALRTHINSVHKGIKNFE